MNKKYLTLYIIAGTVVVLLGTYKFITEYPNFSIFRALLHLVIAVVFYYMAYKTYHEKKDNELM